MNPPKENMKIRINKNKDNKRQKEYKIHINSTNEIISSKTTNNNDNRRKLL